jgi:hypothetical protein
VKGDHAAIRRNAPQNFSGALVTEECPYGLESRELARRPEGVDGVLENATG